MQQVSESGKDTAQGQNHELTFPSSDKINIVEDSMKDIIIQFNNDASVVFLVMFIYF